MTNGYIKITKISHLRLLMDRFGSCSILKYMICVCESLEIFDPRRWRDSNLGIIDKCFPNFISLKCFGSNANYRISLLSFKAIDCIHPKVSKTQYSSVNLTKNFELWSLRKTMMLTVFSGQVFQNLEKEVHGEVSHSLGDLRSDTLLSITLKVV